MTTRPRVAFVLPAVGIPSGWRSLTRSIVEGAARHVDPVLLAERTDAAVVTELWPEYEQHFLPATQRHWWRNPQGAVLLFATWLRLKRLDVGRVDLVNSLEAYPAGLVGHWLSQRMRVPHVVTAAGTFGILAAESRIDRPVYERVLRGASVLCPISDATGDEIRKHFAEDLRGLRVRKVLLGTDYAARVPKPRFDRPRSEPPIVLSVGALKARKGFELSLQAFGLLKKRVPTAKYVIVGSTRDSRYVRELRSLIERDGIRDVTFAGEISDADVAQHYRKASVFLLTPIKVGFAFEGFGLVYLEAGAHGVPVVGTRTGGVPDAVLDGKTGFLQAPDDAQALASSIERLMTDQALARTMGAANRAWSEHLTYGRCGDAYMEVYRSVLG